MTCTRILLSVSLLFSAACSAQGGTTPLRDSGVVDSGVDAYVPPPPPRDAGPMDGNVCGDLTTCGDVCVDTTRDALNCGACDTACPAPANAAATCGASACGFRCFAGFAAQGDGCVPAPRQIRPPSLSTVSSHTPRFTWTLPTDVTAVTLQVCSDPDCTIEVLTVDVTGTDYVADPPLDPGRYFWRVSAMGVSSATWQFLVSVADGTRLTAFGVHPDYDGDGSGDLVIGAPRVLDVVGRVYVYSGSSTGPSASPSQILRAPDGGDFGVSLAAAGDLNGDGLADLAVGADAVGGVTGAVYIYLGAPEGLPTTPSIVLTAPVGTRFGAAVSAAGDVNADGFGDLLASAIGDSGDMGHVFLYRGAPSGLEGTPSRDLMGEPRFGATLAAAGDLNGDLFADIAIGTPNSSAMNGEVQVFYGGPTGIGATANVTLAAPVPTGQFGSAIAGAGDVNGDGFSELAVAAPNADGGRGHVYVYRGDAAGLSTDAPTALSGLSSGSAFFGHGLAFMGDADRDGFDDLAIGAFGVDGRSGRISIHRGSAAGIVTAAAARVDSAAGSNGDFGFVVAAAGDVDMSGRPDLVVGAPGVTDGVGRAYVYRGAAMTVINNRPLLVLTGPAGGAFGRSLASAGR
ncbi:MAG: hypothetical protein GW913_02345 [Myxococcales bacterium]|nr:hypothetical protein [Myxococcales bacterium]